MAEVIVTGEWADEGYEYPPVCPISICGIGGPDTTTEDRHGKFRCDECGKVIVTWYKQGSDQ